MVRYTQPEEAYARYFARAVRTWGMKPGGDSSALYRRSLAQTAAALPLVPMLSAAPSADAAIELIRANEMAARALVLVD